VPRAVLIDLTSVSDARGLLTVAQYPPQIPFATQRAFFVTASPQGVVRGGHAHRACHQLLIVLHGRVLVEWEDDDGWQSVVLDATTKALYVPPLVWAQQTYLVDDSALAVLASHPYDLDDYIDARGEAALERARSASDPTSPNFVAPSE